MIDKGQIYTYMQSKSAITDIVGTRIFPNRMREGVSLPAIVLTTISNTHERHLGGGAGEAVATLQIDCWADTEAEVGTLANVLRDEFDTFEGLIGSMRVGECLLVNERDGYQTAVDGSDRGSFRVSQDYRIWYSETIPAFT